MLDELLNKGVTLKLAEAVKKAPPRARSLDPRVWIGKLALDRSVAAEKKTLGPGLSQKDRKSYIPRDMVLSYLQAHGEEHADAWTATGVAFAEGYRPVTGFDYHWVTEFLVSLTTHLWRRVLFRLPAGDPAVTPLAADARIVLVSDWGTGEGVALAVAKQMRRQIDEAGGREVHVVHLGDVYYAGTPWEAQHRFLAAWPVHPEEAGQVRSWCLNGNHDMYSAGEGLFDVILADGRFARQRTEAGRATSEFHLRNDDWDVAGLDTSWKFHLLDLRGAVGHLEGRQRRWLTDRLQRSEPGGASRRRMLLTHHQPFTRQGGADRTLGNLLRATSGLRSGRGIDAWFWGHEHRLFAFGARDGIGYATCMGHGAVLEDPASGIDAGPGEAEFLATFEDADHDTWRMPGFTVVDLDGRHATVRYLDMNGDPWRDVDVL